MLCSCCCITLQARESAEGSFAAVRRDVESLFTFPSPPSGDGAAAVDAHTATASTSTAPPATLGITALLAQDVAGGNGLTARRRTVKVPWTADEDDKLRRGLAEFGCGAAGVTVGLCRKT